MTDFDVARRDVLHSQSQAVSKAVDYLARVAGKRLRPTLVHLASTFGTAGWASGGWTRTPRSVTMRGSFQGGRRPPMTLDAVSLAPDECAQGATPARKNTVSGS